MNVLYYEYSPFRVSLNFTCMVLVKRQVKVRDAVGLASWIHDKYFYEHKQNGMIRFFYQNRIYTGSF